MSATILAAFLEHARQSPGRACLRFAGETISYGQLAAAAAGWANSLRQRGARPGDRVALYLENSPQFLAAYLGAHMAGAIVVLVNIQYRQVELRHILGDSGARLCITDAERRPELARVEDELPDLEAVIEVEGSMLHVRGSSPQPSNLPPSTFHLPNPDDVALLAYTSGTTGRSKGAMLTHGNLAANSAAVTAAWRWTSADTLLLMLPLFHIHGLGVGVHGSLLAGGCIDLRRRFDAAEALDALLAGGVTMFFGVPTMYTRLIAEARARTENTEQRTENSENTEQGTKNSEDSEDSENMEQGTENSESTEHSADCSLSSVLCSSALCSSALCSSVRLFVSGSAALAPQTFAEFAELFGHTILERYGMTETVMNLTNPYDGERRPGTVGLPFPGQEARIVDVRGRAPLPDGAIGEIQVRGPHVFRGYWGRPDATAEAFDSDGWFNTGDLGWRSADGYFTITGRAKELIISGGYNVYPREVEEVLLSHPAVAEAAVFGLPDPEYGEQVVAAIVPIADFDAGQRQAAISSLQSAITGYCRERLARFKIPRRVIVVEALPRNAMGKVQKHLLRERMG